LETVWAAVDLDKEASAIHGLMAALERLLESEM
jgi:hypothetical protein